MNLERNAAIITSLAFYEFNGFPITWSIDVVTNQLGSAEFQDYHLGLLREFLPPIVYNEITSGPSRACGQPSPA